LIEVLSIVVAYTTMGLVPLIYNFLNAKRAAKRRSDEVDGEAYVEEAEGFTLTVPCSFEEAEGPSNEGRHVIHLSVKSQSPLLLPSSTHVKRVLRQG
jgi:hypothetical protein